MELRMPKLDVTMTEGTFAGWLVVDGAEVQEGELLYTVATDKVETDIPAPCGGTVHHGDVEQEQVYPVGALLGRIESSG